jgi:hypothetical protein
LGKQDAKWTTGSKPGDEVKAGTMVTGPTSNPMSERAALNLLCSISDRFTDLCLYMTIACEWRVAMGPETHEECVHNQRTAIWQPNVLYVLHAVQPEVCTTGMLANFNQTLEAW